MDRVTQIPELRNKISSNLGSNTLSKFRKSSKTIYDTYESNEIWLDNIDARFGIHLTAGEAHDMLLKFIERDFVGYMSVVLYDEHAENEDDIVTVLGRVLVKTCDTVAELLDRLDKRFGILGDVLISPELPDEMANCGRMSAPSIHFAEYANAFVGRAEVSVSGYILQHDEDVEPLLQDTLNVVIPQFFISTSSIVFVKRDYSEQQLADIRALIAESLNEA